MEKKTLGDFGPRVFSGFFFGKNDPGGFWTKSALRVDFLKNRPWGEKSFKKMIKIKGKFVFDSKNTVFFACGALKLKKIRKFV